MYKFAVGSVVGLIGGIVGSMFGISGAFIIIPLLMLFGLCSSQLSAQGTTLCMLLPPISIFAAYTYYKNKNVDLNLSIILVIFYIVGTVIGSKFVIKLNEKMLRINFAILLFGLACYVLYDAMKLTL
jgi:uncharacterized membrane protein YfcA